MEEEEKADSNEGRKERGQTRVKAGKVGIKDKKNEKCDSNADANGTDIRQYERTHFNSSRSLRERDNGGKDYGGMKMGRRRKTNPSKTDITAGKRTGKAFEIFKNLYVLFKCMSIHEQLIRLQKETEIYRKKSEETDKPSFFYFVEHCGHIKAEADKLFAEVSEMHPEIISEGNNVQTVTAIRRVARKTMAEQKLIAKASEPPISRVWTAEGIQENAARIKKLEKTAAMKTENLEKLETIAAGNMTIANYKNVREMMVLSLKDRKKNSKSSVEKLIPMKYRVFIGKSDIQTVDMLLNFISGELSEEGISEIEKMNYVEFKYSIFMLITALRITYLFPPNYEAYRFCAMLPKNPNENSELVQKLPDLIEMTDSKMTDILRLAKTYEKYEQYEEKVLHN